jgi:hypothetical protein
MEGMYWYGYKALQAVGMLLRILLIVPIPVLALLLWYWLPILFHVNSVAFAGLSQFLVFVLATGLWVLAIYFVPPLRWLDMQIGRFHEEIPMIYTIGVATYLRLVDRRNTHHLVHVQSSEEGGKTHIEFWYEGERA